MRQSSLPVIYYKSVESCLIDQGRHVLKVLLWGCYDLSKPRVRILRDGLRAAGVELIEIHGDLWGDNKDKSQVAPVMRALYALRLLIIYPQLIWRYCRADDHDLVFVPYMGQFDVYIIALFAKLRRKKIAWDMFISLYDTVVMDRRMCAPPSLSAKFLKWVEQRAVKIADLTLLDTNAHARYIEKLLNADAGTIKAVPVGAERDAFPTLKSRQGIDEATKVLFYGQLIPLHGVATILDAALSERGREHEWHLIGDGQDRALLENALTGINTDHIRWTRWVDYDQLKNEMVQADICLGIFGTSDKAASVVPNKVYQALFAGRSVITRASPAMTEMFGHETQGLTLVPEGNAIALLDAIDDVAAKAYPVADARLAESFAPNRIGTIMRALFDEVR